MVKIISGGQTGADRAGLDVAIQLKLPHNGWCPAGRKAEDGRIPDCYNLKETNTSAYETRTEMNVINSDGTIVFTNSTNPDGFFPRPACAKPSAKARPRGVSGREPRTGGTLSGGSALTIQMAQQYKKPYLHIELDLIDNLTAVKQIRKWLKKYKIKVVNIAGSRESESPGIYKATKEILIAVLN
jgi:hypothetical protein